MIKDTYKVSSLEYQFLIGKLTSALGTLATETASGLLQGKTIEEALKSATCKGLTSFANGFMIGAAIASVGVVSGIIKPTACFVAGTPVAVVQSNGTIVNVPIETIAVGDKVMSFDAETGEKTVDTVCAIQSNVTEETVKITVGGETIVTTPNHPFYVASLGQWIKAAALQPGYHLFSLYGEDLVVEAVEMNSVASTVTYNFTVENNHTYFVGETGIGVHNTCDNVLRKKATAAQKSQ